MKLNNKIRNIIFVTNFGDFLTLFTIMSLVYSKTNSVATAAIAVPMECIAHVLGGILTPRLVTDKSARSMMLKTQIISALFSAILISTLLFDAKLVLFYFIAHFSLKVLSILFSSACEVESKKLGTPEEQTVLQGQLFKGFFAAQMVGPLVSLFLLKFFPIYVPLLLDFSTFVVAAIVASSIKKDSDETKDGASEPSHIFKPFSYFPKYPNLQKFFWLRISNAFPTGIFNILMVILVQKALNLQLIDTAIFYSAAGIMAYISSTFLANHQSFLHKFPKKNVLLISYIGQAFGYSLFGFKSFFISLIGIAVAGAFNAASRTISQGIRREISTNEQLPEIVGLEFVIAKTLEWICGISTAFFIGKGLLSHQFTLFIACFLQLSLGIMFFKTKYLKEEL